MLISIVADMFLTQKVNLMYSMNRDNYLDDRNLNRKQRRALEKAHRMLIQTYPETLEPIPENSIDVPYSSHPEDIKTIFRSKKFTVILYKPESYFGGKQRFSICRNEW